MHVPDGFLDSPTSIATGVVAAAAIAVAVKRSRAELTEERSVPMLGLAASVVFAAQMINFPVGDGTSGHLMGGALAAILVGPATAVLCLSVVLIVQALVFADGGVTALGTNITLMGIVTVLVGWAVFRGLMKMLPPTRVSMVAASAVGAFVSVPTAAAVFALLFALGGQAPVSLGAMMTAMLGWHTLIGVGEAVITALIVSAVVASRPDLVYGAKLLRAPAAARATEVFA